MCVANHQGTLDALSPNVWGTYGRAVSVDEVRLWELTRAQKAPTRGSRGFQGRLQRDAGTHETSRCNHGISLGQTRGQKQPRSPEKGESENSTGH